MIATSVKVRVGCDTFGCHLPVAYFKDGILIIESQHHGDKHITAINLQVLLAEGLDNGSKISLQ